MQNECKQGLYHKKSFGITSSKQTLHVCGVVETAELEEDEEDEEDEEASDDGEGDDEEEAGSPDDVSGTTSLLYLAIASLIEIPVKDLYFLIRGRGSGGGDGMDKRTFFTGRGGGIGIHVILLEELIDVDEEEGNEEQSSEKVELSWCNLCNLWNRKVSDNDLRCLERAEGEGEEEIKECEEREDKGEGISRETDKISMMDNDTGGIIK